MNKQNLIECAICHNRVCEAREINALDICPSGIIFFCQDEQTIYKKKDVSNNYSLAMNLRHELNKLLQFILIQIEEIDPPDINNRQIDFSKPTSKIACIVNMIDHFIEMIASVNSFQPDKQYTNKNKKINLFDTIDSYINAYGLIKNTRRNRNLKIDINNKNSSISIPIMSSTIEYLIAIFIDNLWKYSTTNNATISIEVKSDFLLDLCFTNIGVILPENEIIFQKGYKYDSASEGYGFGLYWAKALEDYYNSKTKRTTDFLNINHTQSLTAKENEVEHKFIIQNIAYS